MLFTHHTPAIRGFFGPNRFLSNFYPSPIILAFPGDPPEPLLGGYTWPTVEHAYQATKCLNPGHWAMIHDAVTPGEAKKLGRRCKLRPDWTSRTKLEVMRHLIWEKFRIPKLRQQLVATGDAYLEEANNWGDMFWGSSKGVGANHLGHILMETRARIQSETHPLEPMPSFEI